MVGLALLQLLENQQKENRSHENDVEHKKNYNKTLLKNYFEKEPLLVFVFFISRVA